jgi:hypothetical protein
VEIVTPPTGSRDLSDLEIDAVAAAAASLLQRRAPPQVKQPPMG